MNTNILYPVKWALEIAIMYLCFIGAYIIFPVFAVGIIILWLSYDAVHKKIIEG